MSTTNPLRVGFVGCGSVMSGPYMSLARQLRERGRIETVAACDVVASKESFVKDDLGIPFFSTSYEDVVTSPDVDAVLVLTSMPEHGKIARAALENGKHVLVEKPMATTLAEAAELLEFSKSAPGHLICAPHVVLSPTFQAIDAHLKRGDVGRPHLARARYGWSGPWWGQWFYKSGGGPLFDLGVYNVTSLTGWFGPVRRVTAMAGIANATRVVDGEEMKVEAEDNFQILLDFGNAFFGSVTTGFTMQQYRGPAIELYGSDGTIQMMGDDWAPAGYELWQNSVGAWQIHADRNPHWPWTDGLQHLVECVETGRSPLVTAEHAYHVLEVMLAAIDAARDGQTRTITSTFTPPSFAAPESEEAAHLRHDRSRD